MTEPEPYFAVPAQKPTESGRFGQVGDLGSVELPGGPTLRPLLGKNVMLSFAHYEPHTEAPLHAHEEEQLFVMLEGELEVELDGEVRLLHPGDVALIPPWVPHRVTAGDSPAYQLDVFNPPRQGILDRLPPE